MEGKSPRASKAEVNRALKHRTAPGERREREISVLASVCVFWYSFFYFLFVIFLKANLSRLTKVTKDPVISLQFPEKEDFQQKVKSVKSFHCLS